MKAEPPMTPTGEPEQVCIFCNRHGVDMAVYSIGLGSHLGICLSCSRKAVETLERHQQRNA